MKNKIKRIINLLIISTILFTYCGRDDFIEMKEEITLIAPTNGSSTAMSVTIDFHWIDIRGAESYKLNVFDSNQQLTYELDNNNFYSIAANQLNAGCYNWQVTAYNDFQITKSEIWEFCISPAAPTLNSLELCEGDSTLLTWEAQAGITSYEIEYGTDLSYGNSVEVNTNNWGGLSELASGTYYLRIRGKQGELVSTWADTIVIINPAAGELAPPLLVEYYCSTNTAELSWQSASGDVDGYRVLKNDLEYNTYDNTTLQTSISGCADGDKLSVVPFNNECGDGIGKDITISVDLPTNPEIVGVVDINEGGDSTITWTTTAGWSYEVEFYDITSASWGPPDTIGTGTATKVNIQAGTGYKWRILATDEYGCSAVNYSESIEFDSIADGCVPMGDLDIVAGSSTAFLIKDDDSLWGWGYNNYYELDTGTTTDQTTSVQIGSDTNWKQIAGSPMMDLANDHCIALKQDGTIWAWGENMHGQLGNGTTTAVNIPTQMGSDTDWAHIAKTSSASYAIKTDGTLWGWGRNSHGEVGIGSTVTPQTTPQQIGSATDWIEVYGGHYFGAAKKSDGSLWLWGHNNRGQLGTGDTTNRNTPVMITTPVSTGWNKISLGQSFVLAIRDDGSLWSWGDNYTGELGLGDTTNRSTPEQVDPGSTWDEVAAGCQFSLGIKADCTLWSWGFNWHCELGNGGPCGSSYQEDAPIQVGSYIGWADVQAGNSTGYAIRNDTTIWAWGHNDKGQVGNGSTTDQSSPIQIFP